MLLHYQYPATVATVPLKFPAIVPRPAAVEKLGAVEAVAILFVDLPADHLDFQL